MEVVAFNARGPAATLARDWLPAHCGTARAWFSLACHRASKPCFWLLNGTLSGSKLEKEGDMGTKKYLLNVTIMQPGALPARLREYIASQAPLG